MLFGSVARFDDGYAAFQQVYLERTWVTALAKNTKYEILFVSEEKEAA